jgi:excinuclease ABC subunit B
VTTREKIERALAGIREELKERERFFLEAKEFAKAERLRQRTEYDCEMLSETGYCTGIENYVRYLNLKTPGSPAETLLDYFPKDYLLFIDESHMTVPQVRGMHEGNKSRKQTLIEFGFRLPSALDNRPLNFKEFEARAHQTVFLSATPGPYEYEHSRPAPVGKAKTNLVVEQIIRPTGLLDPPVDVRPAKGQVEDIAREIGAAKDRDERVLITTLTKRMAEDLCQFLLDREFKVKYLHSDIKTLERVEILRSLRTGEIDVLVGVNLLREGLDLPEVSFIAILDADKEGFLRSRDALIQTIGRCARNIHGHVALYANRITRAMQEAMDETNRRRAVQEAHNKEHGITPKSIEKAVHDIAEESKKLELRRPKRDHSKIPKDEKKRLIRELEQQMEIAAENLEYERAADLRDEVELLKREV